MLVSERPWPCRPPIVHACASRKPRTRQEHPIHASPDTAAHATYSTRRDAFEAHRAAIQRRWNLVANIRLLGFVAVALAAWWALRGPHLGKWAVVAALLIVVIGLVAWHTRLRRRRDALAALVAVNGLAIARLDLDWDALPVPPIAEIPRSHPYAWDLDVAGQGSVLRRLSTPVLRNGWQTLAGWLLAPAAEPTIQARQEAVRELAPALDLRQQVEAAGRLAEGEPPDPEPFLAWAGSPPWLLARPWLWLLAIASPLALLALVLAWLLGAIDGPWWLVPVTVNVVLFQVIGRRVSGEVAGAVPLHGAMNGYAAIFRLIGDAPAAAPLLASIRDELGSGPHGATASMSRFARIAGFVIPRGAIIWAPAQMALLWDVHVLHALERWRAHAGGYAPGWLARAGEWEALSALAVLAHDHAAWSFPKLDPETTAFRAEGLAHPLIRAGEAVSNDVTVGPEGTFLFVTGSNMSGKSTLLRAVGLNTVLAMAGAPVAATRLAMPPLDPWTCMRVEDSLARGVSFFMAELQRLKAVVDAAQAASGTATARPVLYLLDEILQGTNTAERQVASRQVLEQLTRCHAIGGVSSHDLGLIADSALEGHAVPVHFAETFTRGPAGPDMTFDYRLRPGLATTTNALALMELLGFDVHPEHPGGVLDEPTCTGPDPAF